ncbi:MAG TPA: hypothetical protein DCG69_07085 [Bacteroidales bacterium]|nr:hypothetical protein [Bacteroidales bacterium]
MTIEFDIAFEFEKISRLQFPEMDMKLRHHRYSIDLESINQYAYYPHIVKVNNQLCYISASKVLIKKENQNCKESFHTINQTKQILCTKSV